jgi:hypothetical protein
MSRLDISTINPTALSVYVKVHPAGGGCNGYYGKNGEFARVKRC